MSKADADNRSYDAFNAVTPQNKEEYIRKINSVKPEKLRIFKVIMRLTNSSKIFVWFFYFFNLQTERLLHPVCRSLIKNITGTAQ